VAADGGPGNGKQRRDLAGAEIAPCQADMTSRRAGSATAANTSMTERVTAQLRVCRAIKPCRYLTAQPAT
jgi:hypothetical protein